jgi:putative spermidine/putrescine transport system ATP-binding protein
VLSPNDGRDALEEGARTGIDWPAHCMRLLPADVPADVPVGALAGATAGVPAKAVAA